MAAIRNVYFRILQLKQGHLQKHSNLKLFNRHMPSAEIGLRHVGYDKHNEIPHEDEFEYEVTQNPEEWKIVERLFPRRTIPEPKPLKEYPSGWRPATDKGLTYPYFAERSKNHMLSVYLQILNRGQLQITQVKRVRGDIWRFHSDLKAYLETTTGKMIPSYVHEANGMVRFKGDYVHYTEQWILKRGF